jgi:hypothetical protein
MAVAADPVQEEAQGVFNLVMVIVYFILFYSIYNK